MEVKATMSEDEVSRLRTENAELRRLLTIRGQA